MGNFCNTNITYEGVDYLNSEAAFQSLKLLDVKQRRALFSILPPNLAKKLGRRIEIRKDWEEIKEQLMYEVVKAKFEQNEELKKQLLRTGDRVLIEGNIWHDNYWGDCKCKLCKHTIKGQNKLGKILMRVRNELR